MADMLDGKADAASRCGRYADDAYDSVNGQAGIINNLAGTHDRIWEDVDDYFSKVNGFGDGQAKKVREAAEIYEATDMEIAAMMDASLYNPQRRAEVAALGRSSGLDLDRETIKGAEPVDPANALRPLIDYRAEMPREPEWWSETRGIGMCRKTVWEVTWIAAELGLIARPHDVAAEVVVPFTGDWARLMTCGDALTNLAQANRGLHTNVALTEQHIDAVWQGNAADACWLQVRRLQQSVGLATDILDGYGASYHEVVTRVKELERTAAEVVEELLDWVAVAILSVWLGPVAPAAKIAAFVEWPPFPVRDFLESIREPLVEVVKRVFLLTDLIQLAIKAVFDFETRVQLGLLHGPEVDAVMPDVPNPSGGYY